MRLWQRNLRKKWGLHVLATPNLKLRGIEPYPDVIGGR
jgi:hypothetical protein